MSNAAILYKHPEYISTYDTWKVARDLYEGKREVITRPEYLWYHAIELKDKNFDVTKFLNGEKTRANTGAAQLRKSREERTRYPGLQEVIVSLWQSLFFAEPGRPDNALEALLKDHNGLNNINGFGTSLHDFLQNEVLVSRLLYGKSVVLVDSMPIVARNLQEQRELGLRPFMSCINPLDVPDWKMYTDSAVNAGKYESVRYEFIGVIPRQSLQEQPQLRKYSHILSLVNGKYQIDEYYQDLDNEFKIKKEFYNAESKTETWAKGKTQIVDLDFLPVSIYTGQAWLDGVGQEVLRHYNIRSNRDNILYNNGYDVKYAKGVDSSNADAIAALSEYTIVLLPENGDFGKLEQTDPTGLKETERESVEHIFRVGLNKLRQIASDSKEIQSAEGQDKDNEYTFRLVEAELQSVEDSINDSFKHYAAFLGKPNFDGKLELEKKVSAENFDKFIYAWGSFKDSLMKVEGLEKAVIKKVIKKLRLDSKEESEILKKVDSVNFEIAEKQDEENDPINNALNG
jgi:hypothetical protein